MLVIKYGSIQTISQYRTTTPYATCATPILLSSYHTKERQDMDYCYCCNSNTWFIIYCPHHVLLFFPFPVTAHITEFSEDVAISEGGHFKYTCGYLTNGDEIQISITVKEEGPVDVYIMQSDQYEGAYGVSNTSVISFSALFKKENIIQLNETYCLNKSIGWGEIYVVIDNRDTPLTLNDATPTGSVLVKTEIKTIEMYEFD